MVASRDDVALNAEVETVLAAVAAATAIVVALGAETEVGEEVSF